MLKGEEGSVSRCYGIRAGQSLGSFDCGAFPGDEDPAEIWRRLLDIGYKGNPWGCGYGTVVVKRASLNLGES